jgi:glycosyltransferase involved in cell wall biosynthesis
MKKIAIVRCAGSILNPNLYNIQEIGLAKALLVNKGISVDVFMVGKQERTQTIIQTDKGIVTLRLLTFIKFPGQQALMKNLFLNLLKDNYDLIQVHEYHFILSCLIARFGERNNIPVVLCQGLNQNAFGIIPSILQKVYDILIWPFYKNKFSGFCAKTNQASAFLKRKGIKSEIYITPIGLDTDKFRNYSEINWREKLGITEETKIILNISDINPNKNPKFLIEIFYNVLKKYQKDVLFVWVGKIADVENFNECNKLIKLLNIENKVLFPGVFPQQEIASLYKQSELFISASNTGIYGMTYLEAMYFGLPVVTNIAGGSEQIIENGASGFLCPIYQNDSWINAVLKLLNDNELYNQISQNSKIRINNLFVWSRAVDNFYNFYNVLYENSFN